MDPLYHTATLLENALELVARGVKIFPCHRVIDGQCTCGEIECKSAGKHPRTKEGSRDASALAGEIRSWAKRWPDRVNFGQDLTGRLVVDVDVAEGKQGPATLRELLTPEQLSELSAGVVIRTGRGGQQFIFRLPESRTDKEWSALLRDKLGPGVDVKRCARHYVMVPGSRTDADYAYEHGGPAESEPLAPDWLTQLACKPTGTNGRVKVARPDVKADLPAESPERGDNWTLSNIGRYASRLWPHWDLFIEACLGMNARSRNPIDEDNIRRKCEYVWAEEVRDHKQRSMKGTADGDGPYADSGFLVGGFEDSRIRIRTQVGKDLFAPTPWTNFDLSCRGIAVEPDGGCSYEVAITRSRDRERVETEIDDRTLADPRRLSGWLSAHRVGIVPESDGIAPKGITAGARLQAYLEYQNPPRYTAVDHLGWQGKIASQEPAFVCWDGMIRPAGMSDLVGVRPAPYLRSWGKWKYGFAGAGMAEALDVLRWVMEFREEQPAGVFAAWLTALVLKGRFQTELFPIFSIESSRETGKSTGFFAMMLQLFGNARTGGQFTYPTARDALSSHGNAAVWIDDATRLEKFGELLRLMPVSGSAAKKGQDRTSTEDVVLRSGLLITGEGLGSMGLDPALLDRFVRFGELAPVKSRMSRRYEGQPQLADLRELQRRYPDTEGGGGLTALAGWVVQRILQVGAEWEKAGKLAIEPWETEPGRIGAGNGILRMGARIFAEAIESDEWVEAVDTYCAGRRSEDVRTFTESEILPYVIRQASSGGQIPSRPGPWGVWLSSGRLYINVGSCVDVWANRRNLSERDQQLGQKERMGNDLKAMGAERVQSRVPDLGGDGIGYSPKSGKVWVRVLSREATDRILEVME